VGARCGGWVFSVACDAGIKYLAAWRAVGCKAVGEKIFNRKTVIDLFMDVPYLRGCIMRYLLDKSSIFARCILQTCYSELVRKGNLVRLGTDLKMAISIKHGEFHFKVHHMR